MSADSALAEARRLRAAGAATEALALLGNAIRNGDLSAETLDKMGRFIAKELEKDPASHRARQVLFLGQCTTSWLPPALTAIAWGCGMALQARDGEYDNILQELSAAGEEHAAPDFVVLLPWHQRLLSDTPGRSADDRIADEIAFWQHAWTLCQRLRSRIVQVGYDWDTPGTLGYLLGRNPDSNIALVRRINDALAAQLPDGMIFLDLGLIAGGLGRDRFYDARRYFWTKQPFSEDGVIRLAEHLVAALRARLTGPKKVLVVDLDNTLWGGVVGETGPLGMELGESPDGEAFRAFQRYVRDLGKRGCVLAVCSKNNLEDARQPFLQNPNMVLSLDDFGAFDASWDPKSQGLRRISDVLQLGLDSFVFFDDNPFEREQVRRALPEVAVVQVPDDPAGFIKALERGLFFEAATLTEADAERTSQYRVERQRRELQGRFASLDEYLGSLEMQATVSAINDADMPRVVQLLAKTNQFNLTTRRHAEADVRDLLGRPRSCGLTFRMADRFGDHGLIAVVIAVGTENRDPALRIDTWLMSCRVIGRTVEQYILATIVQSARDLGYQRLLGEFVPSAKNRLVADLYERLGFTPHAQSGDLSTFTIDLSSAVMPTTYVQPASARHGN